jgi:hypothetical protein
MKPGKATRKLLVSIFFLMVTVFISAEGKMNSKTEVINPALYADYQSSSYLAISPSVSWKQRWKYLFSNSSKCGKAVHISIAGDAVVVGCERSAMCLKEHAGELLWEEPLRKKFDYRCSEEGLLVDVFARMRRYTSGEKISRFISTPENCYLTLFEVSGENLFYAYRTLFEPHDRGEEPWKPRFTIEHFVNGREYSYYSIHEPVVANLFSKDLKHFVAVTENRTFTLQPLTDMQTTGAVKAEYGNLITGSLLPDGNLALIEKRDDSYFLRESQFDGKSIWELSISGTAKTNQPPAHTPAGQVFYLAGDELLCVEKGAVRWTRALGCGALPCFMSVFDSGALVAAGPKLYQIGNDGALVREYDLSMFANCRPVVDQNGRIYVGGIEGILCIY